MLHAFYQKHINKYHLITAESPFAVKVIECVHQTGPRNGA